VYCYITLIYLNINEYKIKYPTFDRRITNSIATTNNDNLKTRRSQIPVRTSFGGFAVSAILILSCLLLAIQINQSAWAAAFPGPVGQIASVKGSGMDPDLDEIYVMDADGSEQTQLTDNDADDVAPSWSPDGEKIAFTSIRDVDDESEFNAIYLMNADDGSHVTRLTNPPNAHYGTIDWGTNTSTPDDDDDHKDKKKDP
jgi:hypothetical protein